MSTAKACVVQFFGGPLDGHQQAVSLPPSKLNDVVLLPVGKIQALLHQDPSFEELNNMAVYELDSTPLRSPRYRYVGPCVSTLPVDG